MREYDYIKQEIAKWEAAHPEPKDPDPLEHLGIYTYKVLPAQDLDRIWIEVTDDSESHHFSYRDPNRGELHICIRVNNPNDGNDHLETYLVILHLNEALILLEELKDATERLETLVTRHKTHLRNKEQYNIERRAYIEGRNNEWSRLSDEWQAMQPKEQPTPPNMTDDDDEIDPSEDF